MDHKHSDHKHSDHKALYIHGVLSQREHKAIKELDIKISEAKQCDLSQWTRETSAELYNQYVECCACDSDFNAIRQALIIKDYETARPLIASHLGHLPECVALLADYDFLKS